MQDAIDSNEEQAAGCGNQPNVTGPALTSRVTETVGKYNIQFFLGADR